MKDVALYVTPEGHVSSIRPKSRDAGGTTKHRVVNIPDAIPPRLVVDCFCRWQRALGVVLDEDDPDRPDPGTPVEVSWPFFETVTRRRDFIPGQDPEGLLDQVRVRVQRAVPVCATDGCSNRAWAVGRCWRCYHKERAKRRRTKERDL